LGQNYNKYCLLRLTILLENGPDIKYIQQLLGHNDIKTTLLYLHTSNKDLVKITSPPDDLRLT
jgi:integrase/recombinase XerD